MYMYVYIYNTYMYIDGTYNANAKGTYVYTEPPDYIQARI